MKISFDDPYEDDACTNCGELFGRDVHESRIPNLCMDCYEESMSSGFGLENENKILPPKVVSHPPTPEQRAAFEAAQEQQQE